MKFEYRKIRLSSENLERLDMINRIIREYQADGYVLTLRQLYYQLVTRDVIPNVSKEYDKLGVLLKEGRMGGIVDWDAIEDRLRKPSSPPAWDSPADLLEAAANQFQLPRMQGQETYLEVWVEKDALSGVLSRVTRPYHIPIMVNRGYSSASAMHDAYERFENALHGIHAAKRIRVLYLGDFDPSGLDMVQDVEKRIREFFLGRAKAFDRWTVMVGKRKRDLSRHPEYWKQICLENLKVDFEIIPIALTKKQIEEYNPPPNPAKTTDTRFNKFSEAHGDTSWEVDALPPEVLNQILTDEIEAHIDRKLYDERLISEEWGREKLLKLIPLLEKPDDDNDDDNNLDDDIDFEPPED